MTIRVSMGSGQCIQGETGWNWPEVVAMLTELGRPRWIMLLDQVGESMVVNLDQAERVSLVST
jgi:hypothetical protein